MNKPELASLGLAYIHQSFVDRALKAVSKPVAEVVRLLEAFSILPNSATEVALEMGTSKLCNVKIYTQAQ